MKKKVYKLIPRVSFASLLAVSALGLTLMISCKSSHSVKDIMAARQPDAGFVPDRVRIKVPTTTQDAMTKELFMQSKRSTIELPVIEGSEKGRGTRVVSEEVTFTNAERINRPNAENQVTDLSQVQHLNEVVVTAKSRFTPEQNGRVNVDFIVRVPKELISTNWKVTVLPKLLHNDSIVPLQEVLVKGQNFSAYQKQGYADYEEYVNSIVDKAHYDSVFVDHEAVRQDIAFHQSFYYNQYHKEWSRQQDYDTWKSQKDEAEALNIAKQAGYDRKTYFENARKAKIKAMQEYAKGKDTTGFFARYMKNTAKPDELKKGKIKIEQKEDYRIDFYQEYSRRAKEQILRDWANGKDTMGAYSRYMKRFDKNMKTLVLDGEDLTTVPEKFRDLYRAGRSREQIMGQSFTEQDSIEIAQHHYKFDEIALNEMKRERMEDKRKELIVFPYEQGMRLDTVVYDDRDFVYYYKQEYPVAPGLRRLGLTMDVKVEAIDRSTYVQPRASDTLSYFISSLSQLVDPSLIVKTTTVHRDVYNSMVIYPKFQPRKSAFNINYLDNKAETDKVINTYRTFTDEGKLFMDSVVLRVSTSLDGSYDDNIELSMKRVEALKNYFVKALGGGNTADDMSEIFKIRYTGEDWNTLARMVVRRNDMPNKQEILDMLTQAVNPDQCEADIKKKYPADFRIIRDSIYPMLNKADVIFNMTRPDMAEEVTVNQEERPEYAQALEYLQDREYWKALDILSNYPDYNTALCLLCMGYNNKALELLESLPQTGNSEYLLAILAIRSGDESAAKDHLRKACELDPSKAYRVPLDPEVDAFVIKHNMQGELNTVGMYEASEILNEDM